MQETGRDDDDCATERVALREAFERVRVFSEQPCAPLVTED